jgi:hypothetical protein
MDIDTIDYLKKNDLCMYLINDNFKKEEGQEKIGKISLESSELRSFITKIIFRESGIYYIILKLINNYLREIEKINAYRSNNNLFKFYIKGNMALLTNLLKQKHYKDLRDPKIEFDPSDIDTNLFIDISSAEGVHIENISKSISQRFMYMYRRAFETNKNLKQYLNSIVVQIANTEENEIKQKYGIRLVKKIKSKDRLMYKKKGFISRWKKPYDENYHDIIVSFNETIEDFLLYRLFVPYMIEFKDNTRKIVNAELIDLSIVRINPALSLYKSIKMNKKIEDDIFLIINNIKENKEIPEFNIKYNLEYLLWDKITNRTEDYLQNIDYYGYNLPYASLLYLLFEYCLILINDPKDIKNKSKIEKIKLILKILKNKKIKF